jgi:hypothetical protein
MIGHSTAKADFVIGRLETCADVNVGDEYLPGPLM